MIKIENLYCYYGEIEALHGLSLSVQKGKITSLIGNNGAGKSSLLKSISGMTTRKGSIIYDGERELINEAPVRIAKTGIIQVPEGRHCFPGLTVEQNLETGTINWHGFFGKGKYDDLLEEVYDLFPRLKERRAQYAWSLSGGEQQMLAVGRALMGRPKILMLDEPSMGLAPMLIAEVLEKVVSINREKGLTILLVEQNARQALKISDYTYVMSNGRILKEGASKEMLNDETIVHAYLGKVHRKK